MSQLLCAELLEQLRRGASDWMDPRVPQLLGWIRSGQRRSELQELVRLGAALSDKLDAARAGELADVLAELGCVDLAYTVSAVPHLASDASLAARRARFAMQLRDYAAAVCASDVAIVALLQPGLSVDAFLRRCSAGAPAEGMLRIERRALAQRSHLSGRLAVRWEALHRAGMTREATLMQWMCQRYFPERASVWATAGNHALDANDLDTAERYFQRCLQLNAEWTAALAGMAIVCERRKDWTAALPYRRRVLEVEDALARTDAASLQRRIRYAAALARLGRWGEAEPLFRAAVSCGAYLQLPAERPVLLRVFSQELYAPRLVAALLRSAPPEAAADAGVALAQHEAWLLARLEARLSQLRRDADARWALALCAYLSGELERAYEQLDQLEDERPCDLALHYLLWRCARALASPETRSIRAFAEQAAREAWSQLGAAALRGGAAAPAEAHAQQLRYARAILPELPALPATLEHPTAELAASQGSIATQLERIALFRATHAAPLSAAAASTHALAAAGH